MRTLPLAEAKAQLSRLVDQVAKTDEEILITRNGRPAAVLVSPEEYESWRETEAIRADPELMGEIRRGLRALKRGAGSTRWRSIATARSITLAHKTRSKSGGCRPSGPQGRIATWSPG
jgi:prevent-host-death family protein